MNLAALYHRPDSEMAYLVKKDDFQIRLRTGTNEVEAVILYYGDPYDVTINDKKKQIWEYQIQEMALQASTSLYDYWQLNVSVPLKRLQYFFKIKFKNGEEFLYDDRHIWSYSKTHLENSSGFRMPYFHEIDRIKTPDWVKKTVWYQIFPERFANGDHSIDPKGTLPWGSEKPSRTNFFGGDLQGVIDHLDYLEDLGINGIYFCPIFAAHSNHKYDTIDYFNIDPAFGSKEKFKELVDKAHERGIKIMLDAVFNHIGDFSMQWQDVIKNGEKSRFAEWFHINKFPVSYDEISLEQAENLTYEVFAKTPHMPKLNTANPEVQDYLLEIAKYWIEQFDIDAWRLDVADELPMNFLRGIRKNLDSHHKQVMIGEVWEDASNKIAYDERRQYTVGDNLTGVMGYPTRIFVMDLLESVKSSQDIKKYCNEYLQLQENYPRDFWLNTLNNIGTHDTQRIKTVLHNDDNKVIQAFRILFNLPGVPCIYYGDEVGVEGDADPDNRRFFPWEQEKNSRIIQEVKQLVDKRKKNTLLQEGRLGFVIARGSHCPALAIVRYDDQGNSVYNWLNLTQYKQIISPENCEYLCLPQNIQQKFQHELTLDSWEYKVI